MQDGPQGTDPSWSSSSTAAACRKSKYDQFGKDDIYWKDHILKQGKRVRRKEQQRQSFTTDVNFHSQFTCASQRKACRSGRMRRSLFSVLTVLVCHQ